MTENKQNTYSELTPQEWYEATGEYVKPNTKLIYTNEYGGDWIIKITQ